MLYDTWITPAEMHQMLVADGDIEEDEYDVDDIERLMDQLVEEGVMEESLLFNKYRLTSAEAGAEFIAENTPLDPEDDE